MEEEQLTFQELNEYAERARNKAEKKRLKKKVQKERDCVEIVKHIVKELKTFDAAISVRKVGSKQFNLGLTSYSVNVPGIELEDIIKIINDIPALDVVYREPTILEVSFSKAETQIEKPQTKKRRKRWLRFFRKE